MALTPGDRVGSYEIVGPLGAGGMGEVYRARDTKLGREVALKILPEVFALDQERRQRFEREARTLAALNHPHVALVYGVEESGPAIAMELVEGEDLASRIARGPIPIDEALEIANQLANGLEAAHERGIVHRDLKPANVKVRPDGTVKVLDFGLAKSGPMHADAKGNILESPTITSPAVTGQGVVLGTAAYMAPEQAKGKAVDKRADVWAFGCVLFEMLTAKRAFDGEDVTDTLALVLKGEPDWAALPSATPHPVRTLLRRCLERDVRRRISDMSVVRFVLDEAETFRPQTLPVPGERSAPRSSHASRWWAGAAVLLLLTAVPIAAMWWTRPTALDTRVVRFSVDTQASTTALIRRSFSLSPDGRQLVFISNGRLFLRDFSEFEARPIAATDIGLNINTPAFAPDGASVVFHGGSMGSLMRVSVRGGAAVRMCDMAAPAEISWERDVILAGQGPAGIVLCKLSGGATETIVKVDNGEQAFGPQMLPDGRTILFTIAKTADGPRRWDNATIVAQSLATGERKVVIHGGSDGRYLPTGHLVYAVGGVLFAVAFDAERLETQGQAWAVVEGVRRILTGSTQFATSTSGAMAFMPGPAAMVSNERVLAIGSRDGTIARLPVPPAPYAHVRSSRDGSRVLVGTDDGRTASIWLLRLADQAALQRFTIDGNNRSPIWSPDGRYAVFQSDRGGDRALYRQRIDGSGRADRLTTPAAGESHVPESWSTDGKHIAFTIEANGTFRLHTLAVESGAITPVGVQSEEPTESVFSPDGKWLAYSLGVVGGLASPNRGVFVQPFPPTGAIYQAPRQILDFHPAWSPKGDELLYIASATSGQMAAVPVSTADGLTFSSATLFPATVTGDRLSIERRAFDVLPDGRFVGVADAASAEGGQGTSEVRVVLNWFEELKKR